VFVHINRLGPSHLLIGSRCTGEKYARNLREKLKSELYSHWLRENGQFQCETKATFGKLKKQSTTVHVLA
jgi:hypothetical protein